MILLTVILMDLLAGMEFDLFVPSFPELQNQFNLTPFWVEALLSINFIGFCISLFFVGGMADRYGRRPVILVGLLTFVIGSIMCLLGASYEWLLLGRFLQGAGIATPVLLSFIIITDLYPIKQQQRFMAMLNGLMNMSAGFAPVIGSYITMYFHWQGNFTVLLLLGLVALIMTMLFIPNSAPPKHKETISIRGYIPIFKSKPLMLLILNFIVLFVPYWIFVGMSPILFMQDLGVSLAHFGYYQGALALAFGLGSIFYGFIMHKFDQRKMLYISVWIFVASLIAIAQITLTGSSSPLFITLAFLLFCIGQIIPTTIIYPLCLNLMPHAKGRVSAIIQGGRLVLASLGLQIAGYYYVGSFRNIGIMLACFIFFSIITMVIVLKNKELVKVYP